MKTFNNIPKVFFGFLFASILMWLLINLSKSYTSEIAYQINYTNLAQNKIYKIQPPKILKILVKASGFKLLTENLSTSTIELNLETLQKKNHTNYFFLTKNIRGNIQKQLRNGVQIEEIEQDSILIQLDELASKKVPLKPNIKATFQLGYDLAKPIKVVPESIIISGTQNEIDKIKQLDLEELTFDNITQSISQSVTIISPKNSAIKFKNTDVQIHLEVDKFTENEISIPVIVKNVPSNVHLNIFPKKVTITYKVGLSNFNKIADTSFEVVCDYQKAIKDNVNFLIPYLNKKSGLVSSVRISPNKIDFLINK